MLSHVDSVFMCDYCNDSDGNYIFECFAFNSCDSTGVSGVADNNSVIVGHSVSKNNLEEYTFSCAVFLRARVTNLYIVHQIKLCTKTSKLTQNIDTFIRNIQWLPMQSLRRHTKSFYRFWHKNSPCVQQLFRHPGNINAITSQRHLWKNNMYYKLFSTYKFLFLSVRMPVLQLLRGRFWGFSPCMGDALYRLSLSSSTTEKFFICEP